MNARLERTLVVGRAIVHEIRTEKVTFLAGSIAYHAFVSLLPLFLLVLAVIAAIGDAGLERNFIAVAEAVLTEGASDVLITEIRSAGTSVSVFGGVLLVWGTLRIFRGLDTAFSDIYESEAENTFADQLSDGLIVLVTFAIALIAAAAIQSALEFAGTGTVGWLLHRLALVVGLAVVFFPLYYIFPDTDVGVVEVLPGVLLASVGLTAFESLFRFYVETSGRDEGATVVAGILVLLTWLYFSGLVILLGAVVNAVLSNRSRDVNIRPVFGGVPYDPSDEAADRDQIAHAIERLEAILENADEVDRMVVRVGEQSVSFPQPHTVVGDTRSSRFVPGREPSLELTWSPGRVPTGFDEGDVTGDGEADDGTGDAESTRETVADGGD